MFIFWKFNIIIVCMTLNFKIIEYYVFGIGVLTPSMSTTVELLLIL